MHESKHVSRGPGGKYRAGRRRRTADCRGHRRDSGVGVGHPEEAMSRLVSSKRETTTNLALDSSDRKRPVRLVGGVGGSIAFSWAIVLSIHYSDTITTTCPQAK
jgi:hypothetical protein